MDDVALCGRHNAEHFGAFLHAATESEKQGLDGKAVQVRPANLSCTSALLQPCVLAGACGLNLGIQIRAPLCTSLK